MAHIYETLFNELISMKYFKNSFKAMDHEGAVQSILISNGFKELSKEILTAEDKKKIRNSDLTLSIPKDGLYFIFQPLGSQNPPDFILVANGVVLFLECKSSSGDKITWNTSLPKKDYIYLFTSKTHDTSTVFLGQHYVNEEITTIFNEMAALNKKNVEAANAKLKSLKSNTHGFSYYERPMYQQAGGSLKTAVIGHNERETYEREVFLFIGGKIRYLG